LEESTDTHSLRWYIKQRNPVVHFEGLSPSPQITSTSCSSTTESVQALCALAREHRDIKNLGSVRGVELTLHDVLVATRQAQHVTSGSIDSKQSYQSSQSHQTQRSQQSQQPHQSTQKTQSQQSQTLKPSYSQQPSQSKLKSKQPQKPAQKSQQSRGESEADDAQRSPEAMWRRLQKAPPTGKKEGLTFPALRRSVSHLSCTSPTTPQSTALNHTDPHPHLNLMVSSRISISSSVDLSDPSTKQTQAAKSVTK
ncbi:hypothetical protein EGW08_013281, partial [Elysia chlorotica]